MANFVINYVFCISLQHSCQLKIWWKYIKNNWLHFKNEFRNSLCLNANDGGQHIMSTRSKAFFPLCWGLWIQFSKLIQRLHKCCRTIDSPSVRVGPRQSWTLPRKDVSGWSPSLLVPLGLWVPLPPQAWSRHLVSANLLPTLSGCLHALCLAAPSNFCLERVIWSWKLS